MRVCLCVRACVRSCVRERTRVRVGLRIYPCVHAYMLACWCCMLCFQHTWLSLLVVVCVFLNCVPVCRGMDMRGGWRGGSRMGAWEIRSRSGEGAEADGWASEREGV